MCSYKDVAARIAALNRELGQETHAQSEERHPWTGTREGAIENIDDAIKEVKKIERLLMTLPIAEQRGLRERASYLQASIDQCNAATRIQALRRGKVDRARQAECSAAATKIQAARRGKNDRTQLAQDQRVQAEMNPDLDLN